MKVRVYQINGKRDRNHVAFLPYRKLAAVQGTDQIDSQIYDKEEIYRILNCSRPEGYFGRSLSVSDVIELIQDTSGSHFYFCDSVGFREVAFERKADISLLRLLCHPYFIKLKALAKHGFVPISRGYAGPGIYYDDRNKVMVALSSRLIAMTHPDAAAAGKVSGGTGHCLREAQRRGRICHIQWFVPDAGEEQTGLSGKMDP